MANALTDEFLKDLEDLSDDEQTPAVAQDSIVFGDQSQNIEAIPEVSTLKQNSDYVLHMKNIKEELETIQPSDRFINLSPTDPIYTTIKKCNTYLHEIITEIAVLHKEIRDIYIEKFRELESIIYDPIEYTK